MTNQQVYEVRKRFDPKTFSVIDDLVQTVVDTPEEKSKTKIVTQKPKPKVKAVKKKSK